MKLSSIFVLITLIVVVKGNLLVAAARPAILGLGALMAALNKDELPDLDVHAFDWKKWIPFGETIFGSGDEIKEPFKAPEYKPEKKEEVLNKPVVAAEKYNTGKKEEELNKPVVAKERYTPD